MQADPACAGPAPEPPQLDVLDPAFWRDPHATLGALRERHPLAYAPALDAWFVLRHQDVTRLLGDTRLQSDYASLADGPAGRVIGGLLVNQQGARHAHLRTLVSEAFTPRRIERLRGCVRARVRELLAELEPGSVLDLQQAVADPLARRTLCDLLGVPEADAAAFGDLVDAMLRGIGPAAGAEARETGGAAAGEISDYLSGLADRVRSTPGDSLAHTLLAEVPDREAIDGQDFEQVAMSLLFGGTDTVRSFLGIAAWLLLAHPGERERLRATPALAAPMLEEILRFEPPLAGLPRRTTQPVEISGRVLPAGSRMILEIVSANRDPRRFPEPDRFEPLRDASSHLSFGRGTHFCVGAALARLQGHELLLAMTDGSAPRLELAETPRFVPFVPARRLEALRVRVDQPSSRFA